MVAKKINISKDVDKKSTKKVAAKKVIKKDLKIEKVKKEEPKIAKSDVAILKWAIIGKNINLVLNKETITKVATKEEKEFFKKKIDKYNNIANRATPIALKLRNEIIDFVQLKKVEEKKQISEKKSSLRIERKTIEKNLNKNKIEKITPNLKKEEAEKLTEKVVEQKEKQKEEPKVKQGTTSNYGRERYR